MDHEHRERMRKLVDEVVSQNPGVSLDELNRLLSERTADYNYAPQPDMAGLSPAQAHRLLYGGWDGPDAVLLINRNLGLDDLRAGRMLANARLLLASIWDKGSVKATAKGNLNRAFVIDFAKAIYLEPLWASQLERQGNSLKEEDLLEINVLRHVLQIAGLIRRTRGYFYVTKKGAAIAAEDRSGELFALLFETVFRKLNLAVLTRYLPEFPPLQHMIAFSFYAFSTLGDDWHIEDNIYEQLVLPAIRQSITPREYHDPLRSMVRGWILRPMEWLGLAEIEESRWVAGHMEQPERVRKTPLFDRFLEFRLDPSGTAA